MGSKSREKARRRELARQHTRKMHTDLAEILTTPEHAEAMAAHNADRELFALADAHRPAQVARLRAAGWSMRMDGTDGVGMWDHRRGRLRIVHGLHREDDSEVWAHSSISRADKAMPDWWAVRDMQWLLYPEIAGVVVVAAETDHTSVAEVAHVWTRLTGGPLLPDFRHFGMV